MGFHTYTYGRNLLFTIEQIWTFPSRNSKAGTNPVRHRIILLLSAIINYINLTVSQTGKRAHEMATRRLLGDTAGEIVLRYLAESALFTTGCFIGGCLIAVIAKPYFEYLLSTQISLIYSFSTVAYMLLLLVGIAGVSGLIPALIMHRYHPIDIVKGNFRLQNKQIFSRLFIIVQNVISTVLITLGLTMAVQMHHLATLPTGYNTDLVFVKAWTLGMTHDKQVILQERLQALPQVAEVALARGLPFICGHNGVQQPDEESRSWLHLSDMDSAAFRMLGFEVLERWSDHFLAKLGQRKRPAADTTFRPTTLISERMETKRLHV